LPCSGRTQGFVRARLRCARDAAGSAIPSRASTFGPVR
jgi:hypothetical protein